MGEGKRVGVFGHYGNKNLGDEAIILAVIQNLRKRMPDIIINGFSINPEDTSARYEIDSYPIRKLHSAAVLKQPGTAQFNSGESETKAALSGQMGIWSVIKDIVKRTPVLSFVVKVICRLVSWVTALFAEMKFLFDCYRRLRKIDVLMITGSNQFLDNFGGPWGFPYTLLKWSMIAKVAQVKVYYVSVGAGPISQKMSKVLIRWALLFADYVSFRDVSSEKMIREIGYKGKSHVYPDLAHSLLIEHITASPHPDEFTDKKLPIIGINPMPLYDSRYWCEKDDSKYKFYVDKMVEFTGRLIDKGYPFYFFATQDKDNNVINDILTVLEKERQLTMSAERYVLTSETVDELMANIAVADITVATRFHGTVLSLLSEKPMMGICYYRKARELMADMGQNDYAVELDTFKVDDLWVRFENLVENMVIEKQKIKSKNQQYLKQLDLQYDFLTSSAESVGRRR